MPSWHTLLPLSCHLLPHQAFGMVLVTHPLPSLSHVLPNPSWWVVSDMFGVDSIGRGPSCRGQLSFTRAECAEAVEASPSPFQSSSWMSPHVAMSADEKAPCPPTDPSRFPGGSHTPAARHVLSAFAAANPETASLYSLAQSFLTAPTYQGSASTYPSRALSHCSHAGSWAGRLALRPPLGRNLYKTGWLQNGQPKFAPWSSWRRERK